MQKKIYSLIYVCVLDNLNSIGLNGSQTHTRCATFLSPTTEHVADMILSFNVVNVSFQRPQDFYSNQTFMVKTFILIVSS